MKIMALAETVPFFSNHEAEKGCRERGSLLGFGDEIPKQGMGWQPHRNPVPHKKEVVSEQNAKHSTIETGFAQNGVGLNAE